MTVWHTYQTSSVVECGRDKKKKKKKKKKEGGGLNKVYFTICLFINIGSILLFF